jgi:hypothetical protein
MLAGRTSSSAAAHCQYGKAPSVHTCGPAVSATTSPGVDFTGGRAGRRTSQKVTPPAQTSEAVENRRRRSASGEQGVRLAQQL